MENRHTEEKHGRIARNSHSLTFNNLRPAGLPPTGTGQQVLEYKAIPLRQERIRWVPHGMTWFYIFLI